TVRGRVGDNHPAVARELSMLGNLDLLRARTVTGNERQGLADRAQARFERVIEIQTKVYGAEDLRLDDAFHNLGLARVLSGDLEGGREALARALELTSRRLREDHPDVIETKAELGDCLIQLGQLEKGEALLDEVLRVREAGGVKGKSLGTVRLALAARFVNEDPTRSRALLEAAIVELGAPDELQIIYKEKVARLTEKLGNSGGR
ncbi:MAG: tetratricopeptide repeat protein, partial [Nannocystaceae bacterium]